MPTRYYTLSPALAAVPRLATFLGGPVRLGLPPPGATDTVLLGWGRRRSRRLAEAWGARRGLPVLGLEDGFLRSVAMGRAEPPLALAVDDLGIYYDAGAPSRLETLIAAGCPDAAAAVRAEALAAAWRAGRVSKYNHARDEAGDLPEGYVLVADQTWGDAAIAYGRADPGSFRRMLEAALDEHPHAPILLKVHPEVHAGRKRGHFDRLSPGQAARVHMLGRDVHPATLLERAAAVYVVTSQMGFEGLLWGRPVRTFGMPFYAGWGLTGDDRAAPPRRGAASLAGLVHAALVAYPRYVDPETGERCEAERVLDYLAFQRRLRQRFPEAVYALGLGRLRRPAARAYFAGSRLHWLDHAAAVPAGATVAVWGRDDRRDDLPPDTVQVCLEDGFLRSVGLGAELAPPLSLAMDRQGIYYDAGRPSDLESLLAGAEFGPELLARAARLRQGIVAAGLTKYNVAGPAWPGPGDGRRVILVPGQVEADASIRHGAAAIRTNLDLLRAVRARHPDAYLVYKPHPDVEAGLRRGGRAEAEAARHCDEIVRGVAMAELLDRVDAVHCLTSLAGFEALLRAKPVTVWGRPFYAGWGLTEDVFPPERRGRRLTLDALVAGALILYPVYVSRNTGRYTTPERALAELLAWRAEAAMPRPWWSDLGRWLRRRALVLHARLTG